ncbi:MAG: OmpA/MotB domain protein [Bacteroidetes bacterium]|nr:OmpA/MotB domain protein [Bacteroidota bacterium]
MRLKFISVLAITLLLTYSATAQKAYVSMGDMYFKQFDFKMALKSYARAIKKDSNNTHVIQNIADSYRLMNDWTNAEPWYAKLATSSTASPLNKMYYAESLRSNQKYSEAKIAYKSYMASVPSDASVKDRLAGIDKVSELSKDRGLYTVEDMEINSPLSDFGPAFYTNGEMFFCSNRQPLGRVRIEDNWTGANFLQVYQAKPDANGNITSAELMKGRTVNGKYHEGPVVYNEKLQELYITRSNYKKARAFTSSDKTVKLKLYRLVYLPNENRWGDQLIEAVPFNDREYSVGHAALTADGQTLYFASDKPGGYGGVDIYKSLRDQSGNWAAPINLGPSINTSGDEMFPFVSNDGTLYFSSNGHLGLGGLDVFSTSPTTTKEGWTAPENLGFPINTNKDDFNFIIDKDNKNGYFASNRDGGKGDDDIYKFIKKGITICGLVYDAKTNDPIEGSKVVMYEVKDERGNKLTNKDGNFCFSGTPKRVYKFVATKAGYLPNEVTVETDDKPVTVKIPLVKEGGINLEVLVLDKKTREPIDMANVKLINTATNKEEKQQTNPDGKAFYSLEPNATYRIEGSKDLPDPDYKYLTVSTTTSTVGKVPPATIYVTLELERVKRGVAIKVENIYYDLDKWFIRPDAAKELDKLVKLLQDNPTMEIELSSHTDCRATIKYNATLSGKRAESAVQYIASKGVSQSRMVAAGYGESRLVNKCACEGTVIVPCTDDQHQENRRTEFKILKF